MTEPAYPRFSIIACDGVLGWDDDDEIIEGPAMSLVVELDRSVSYGLLPGWDNEYGAEPDGFAVTEDNYRQIVAAMERWATGRGRTLGPVPTLAELNAASHLFIAMTPTPKDSDG